MLRVRFPSVKIGVVTVVLPPDVRGQVVVSTLALPWTMSSVWTAAAAGPDGNQASPAARPTDAVAAQARRREVDRLIQELPCVWCAVSVRWRASR